jgi:hypothetical protein
MMMKRWSPVVLSSCRRNLRLKNENRVNRKILAPRKRRDKRMISFPALN